MGIAYFLEFKDDRGDYGRVEARGRATPVAQVVKDSDHISHSTNVLTGIESNKHLGVNLLANPRVDAPSCKELRQAFVKVVGIEVLFFLQEELLENVGPCDLEFFHSQDASPYFFHRELLTELAGAAYETVHQFMAAAVVDEQARPGMVVAIQTFSDNLKWNPHLHCVVSRGVWDAEGQWTPVPYIDTHAAEILFREKVFRLLQQHDLLSDERIQLLRSWRRSGFSIDNDVYLYPSDTQALQTLCRYIVRCPVSLQRLHYDKKSNYVLYQPRSENTEAELLNPLDFLARVLIHIPEPHQHSILYYGHYARRRRQQARKIRPPADDGEFNTTKRKTLRRRWANLIRRVFKSDPLICKNCGGKRRAKPESLGHSPAPLFR